MFLQSLEQKVNSKPQQDTFNQYQSHREILAAEDEEELMDLSKSSDNYISERREMEMREEIYM